MSTNNDLTVRDPVFGELAVHWKWMLALGILMAVLGIIGLGMTYWLTILSVIWFGVLSLVAGIAQVIEAFKCSGWKAVLGHVVLGFLYLAAGVVLIAMPVQSAWWLTLLIGAFFIVSGVLRIFMVFQMKGGGSANVWLILSGVISILLGILIYSIVDFPADEAVATVESAQAWFKEWGWVIGLFVAIEFIVHGASLAGLALAARNSVGSGNTSSSDSTPTTPSGTAGA